MHNYGNCEWIWTQLFGFMGRSRFKHFKQILQLDMRPHCVCWLTFYYAVYIALKSDKDPNTDSCLQFVLHKYSMEKHINVTLEHKTSLKCQFF